MVDFRRKALESLLNDDVTPVKSILTGVYKWRGIYYHLLPYKKIRKGFSQYNKLKYGRIVYGYKEIPEKTVKQLEEVR